MARMSTLYKLGVARYHSGLELMPLEDQAFVDYIDRVDPAITLSLIEYTTGYHAARDAANAAAQARRDDFTVIE